MVKDNNQYTDTDNEEILNRVNQTFDKINQDVKDMINKNESSTTDDNQYS